MRAKVLSKLLTVLSLIVLCGCQGAKAPVGSVSGSRYGYLHVSNVPSGEALAFYTQSGAYALGTQQASVLNVTSQIQGTMMQNSQNGDFYMPGFCTGCGTAMYFSPSQGFFGTSASNSQKSIAVGATAASAAIDPGESTLYVTDSVHNTVVFLNASTLAFSKTTQTSSTFTPLGASVELIGVYTTTHKLAITDPIDDALVFMDGTNGSTLTANGSQNYLVINNGTSPCDNGIVKEIFSVPTHMFHVLCTAGSNSYDILINPLNLSYASGSLTASSIAITYPVASGIASPNNTDVILVGGNTIQVRDASTGALVQSTTVSTNDCGYTSFTFTGVAAFGNVIYVTDSTNSAVEEFSLSTLQFLNGTCSTSSFSTATDVPNPQQITIF